MIGDGTGTIWFGLIAPIVISEIYIYIFEQRPPPGSRYLVVVGSSLGYRWIRLDPQGPKMGVASRISGPDQCGRRRQVPGGPDPGHPQGLIFWKSY